MGVTRVFLDNHEIASAQASTASKVVEFDYADGMELKFTEERVGVIMFNSFEDLGCTGNSYYNLSKVP